MILLIGIPSEPPLRLLVEACSQKGIPFELFNQRQHADWQVEADPWRRGDSVLTNGPRRHRLNDCAGLYLRTMDQTQVPEYAGSQDQAAINEMYGRLFQVMDDKTTCRVVNAPSVQMSNNSKPYQSLFIKECGLDIPDTCITNDEDEARQFISKYGSVIYKSTSGTRSIVKQVDETSFARLNKIKYCPVQFQECVAGYNVRVHVVGRQVYATKIVSDAVDYRYARAEGKTANLEPYDLDGDIAEKCISLSGRLQLAFSGIDLMMAEDGRTICFEVNPSPGYSYYEQNTGQPISHALADYLAFGA
jgi:hypothetical protein